MVAYLLQGKLQNYVIYIKQVHLNVFIRQCHG